MTNPGPRFSRLAQLSLVPLIVSAVSSAVLAQGASPEARAIETDLTHERWTPYLAISSPRTVAGPRS
jgi:hypothetical protein